MDHNSIIECGGFYFIHNFDSGNLGHVERVPTELIVAAVNPKTNAPECPDYEFNMWTRPDCAGTEFENGNRTWFYFGIQSREPNVTVRLNLINLNKQGKMYNQGMAPVTRTLPGKPQWERIRDRPVHSMDDNTFTLSFKYRTPENIKATSFFAFTYPFSFAELQIALNTIDIKMLPGPSPQAPDDIYYCRECLIYSLEGRRVDLLTISSHHGITAQREERLKHLFPDNKPRALKFQNKKVIFISARVHPGETPSSFVFNGFLNLLLTRNDPVAIQLRKLYVFKMIPFLNPDGVARGHYRTDTRGVNLNRVYLNPSLLYHPTVYASRALIRYYHFGCEKEDTIEDSKSFTSRSIQNINESVEQLDSKKKKSAAYKSRSVSTKSSNSTKPRPPSAEAKTELIEQIMDPKKSQYKAKSVSPNKSSSTLKRPSTADGSKRSSGVTTKPQSSGEDNLVDQVCDLKLREMTSQTTETLFQESPRSSDSPSLLNDDVLRSCLGSDVHLSTSDELIFQGSNPLLPLRDTLKNSISLLMGSPTDSSCKEASNVRMGWCHDCRRAVAKLQESMPGLAGTVAGYNATVSSVLPTPPQPRVGSPCSSIDEYREQQRQQLVEQRALEEKLQDIEPTDQSETVYFCTNCFKRYIVTKNNEEIKLVSGVSAISIGISAGDSGDTVAKPRPERTRVSIGDESTTTLILSPKEEKTNTPLARNRKRIPVPVAAHKSKEPESGLFLYIDLHGHASKKGIFMYGNHFEDAESSVECMLLPRIMSLNNMHFHFSSCNFTERNMYLKDRRDGMSREGSGRVAVLKATGLVRSYTLECNYNTGRLVNVLPPAVRDAPAPPNTAPAPPKYTPHIFEEVGRSLGASILDLTGQHPNSRVPCSEHRNLTAVRDWLRAHTRTMRPQLTMSRLRPKTSSPTRAPLYARAKPKAIDVERKENTYAGAKVAAKSKPSRRSADDADNPRPALSKIGSKRSFARGRGRADRRAAPSSSSDDMPGWEDVPGGTMAGLSRDSLLAAKRRVPAFQPPQQLKKIRLKSGL